MTKFSVYVGVRAMAIILNYETTSALHRQGSMYYYDALRYYISVVFFYS
jgi:hypothetical protein